MGCEQRRGEQLVVLSDHETTSDSKLDWRRRVARNARLSRSRVCAKRPACDTPLERGHTHRTFLGSRFLDPRPQSVAPGLADKLALEMSILPKEIDVDSSKLALGSRCRNLEATSKESFVVVSSWHPILPLWSESVSGRVITSQLHRN